MMKNFFVKNGKLFNVSFLWCLEFMKTKSFHKSISIVIMLLLLSVIIFSSTSQACIPLCPPAPAAPRGVWRRRVSLLPLRKVCSFHLFSFLIFILSVTNMFVLLVAQNKSQHAGQENGTIILMKQQCHAQVY